MRDKGKRRGKRGEVGREKSVKGGEVGGGGREKEEGRLKGIF